MKTILAMALALGIGGLAGAADDKKAADPVGTWKCEYEIGGQKRTCTMTIKQDGDKLAGTMDWPELCRYLILRVWQLSLPSLDTDVKSHG